ncbi:MAG: HD domain-containing phosphohydrolase, partial [Candidatus Hydromicrobium sp.]
PRVMREKRSVKNVVMGFKRPDGVVSWVNVSAAPLLDEAGEINGVVGTFQDITERKNTESEIRYLSYHDQLTGLYNRRFAEEEIKRLDTKRQLPISVIIGNINSLKLTNDTFGHSKGDKILKGTAELLKRICRSDDILSRWGGDEFVILLPKTSITDSEEIVQRIKKECKKLIIQKIPLSLSIGIATKIEVGQDMDEIIIEAESNMYKNKLVEKESNASSIIFALEQALYEKSNETMEHAFRIKDSAIKLGESIKLQANQLDELSLLASLHDIGKVAIPETILLKEGKLTEKERAVIKRHPEIGFNIAQSSPQIIHIAKFILACHENWDGSGYPKGLAGESIPIVSRVISIADAYDVMTSERIYKKAMSKDAAIEELKRCAGTQFDPVLVNKFIEIISN